MTKKTAKIVLILFLSLFVFILTAEEFSPNQILFKTGQPVQLKSGKTGLTAFDSYLESLGTTQIKPVAGIHGNRWFSADFTETPDWNAVKTNSLKFKGIDIIQPNYLNTFHVVPNDPMFSLQQMNLVNLPQAWNYTTGSNMIIVGVVDSGIAKDHPDLQGNIYYNLNEIPDNGIDDDNNGYIDDYCGWDFSDAPEIAADALGDYTEPDNDVTDENYHGTHVSGIIGAVTNNGIGVSGVCWNVKILPVRAGFRTISGAGFLQDDDAAAALIYATDMGASVINMSWGDTNYSPIIADACNYAYEHGIVLVASAGNMPGPYLSYPAKLACVISVSAIDPYKALAGFASYGPELDLVAPGQMVYSTYKPSGPEMYKEMSGTSMSSPFVAGSAALLKSIQPTLSPDEVRAKLLTSTDDLGPDGVDQYFGHGLLNTQKLLETVTAPYINVEYPADNIGISSDFDIIGTVNCMNFFRYSVMCALEKEGQSPVWKDVTTNMTSPVFYHEPVINGVIAHFRVFDLMEEGRYLIRIQYQTSDGMIYNVYRSVRLDQTPPYIRPNTFSVMKRYDGQNVRYYAGALFNEPVTSELIIYAGDFNTYTVFPAKHDSLQVWALPNNIPPGNISVEIHAVNSSNLTYYSPILPDVANIQYETVTNYGYEAREIGPPLVPINCFYDFDHNGLPEFVAMELISSGYGTDRVYEPTDSTFTVKHTYSDKFKPLDLGDTNGSGQELLTTYLETANLYETFAANGYPTTSIWSQTGVPGGILADYNGDYIKDILVIKNLPAENVIQIYKRQGLTEVSSQPKVTLHNTTPTSLRNMFVPTILVQNLDGDTKPDILTADTDGDIMIFEATSATEATMTWSYRLPVANTYYLTTGDFDGNGRTDFFVGGYNTDVLDPAQNYWFFEGFTRAGDNNYQSMGYIQFNNVFSQNAIQTMNVDNDNKAEIILALSPNLYIIKYINGKFQPVFYGNSDQNYQIAAWMQNDRPHILTNGYNAQDSLRAFVWTPQAPFTGPATPANLILQPLNEHQVSISWAGTGANSYRLYRKEANQMAQLLAEVNTTTYLDTTVTAGTTYFYAISAYDTSYNPPESILSQWQKVTPMERPQITNISMISANELRIIFNQPMATTSLLSGCYYVDHDIGNPLSVNSIYNHYGAQLRFRNLFEDIGENYLLTLTNIYGATGVPLAVNEIPFAYNPDYRSPYIVKTEVRRDNQTIDLTMSETLNSASANVLNNYILTPPENDPNNTVHSVNVNDNVITVVLSSKLKYASKPYYLTLRNISDLQGNEINLNQNFCSFYRSDITNLDKVVTYPNPVHTSEYKAVNFMNFPAGKRGTLSIYNISGDLIYHAKIGPFNPTVQKITCQWNLENSSGRKVSSGIYFYVINMENETKKGKIAVLN
ncbi:MAG TPA: S8 family serine peptidase [Candidatus Cloacimonadota bacterium]|nr:S8 family serine peptidase [Candidatus Cloacimonadota bacterium]